MYSNRIIGLHLNQALAIYPNIRVVVRDGRQLPTTMDYRTDRINVETRNGIIQKVVGHY